jgi:hypothetical protein
MTHDNLPFKRCSFLKIYGHAKFLGPILNDCSVAYSSDVRIFHITGDMEVKSTELWKLLNSVSPIPNFVKTCQDEGAGAIESCNHISLLSDLVPGRLSFPISCCP